MVNRGFGFLLLVLVIVALSACSDGDDIHPMGTPTPFELLVTVETPDGDPVPGVSVGSMPAVPDEVFPFGPDKSMVDIRFDLIRPAEVRMTIQDVTGAHIRTLVDDAMLPEGRHGVSWNGRDETGEITPPGYYTVHMFEPYGDNWAEIDRRALLQASFDTSVWSWGTSDELGQLVVSDSRIAPGLYNTIAVRAVNESGDQLGSFEITDTVWLMLSRDDRWQWAVVEVTSSNQSVQAIWQPDPLPGVLGGGGGVTKDDDVPPVESGLELIYPNPFN